MLSTALAVVFIAGAFAQAKPDFNGTWKPDPARSKPIGGLGPTQTISVEGNKMTMLNTSAGNTSTTVYLLDGTPSTKTLEGGDQPVKIVYTSKWEGNVLVTTWANARISNVERRTIQDDGTMKVEVTHTYIQDGKSETGSRVFNKVKK